MRWKQSTKYLIVFMAGTFAVFVPLMLLISALHLVGGPDPSSRWASLMMTVISVLAGTFLVSTWREARELSAAEALALLRSAGRRPRWESGAFGVVIGSWAFTLLVVLARCLSWAGLFTFSLNSSSVVLFSVLAIPLGVVSAIWHARPIPALEQDG